jgi:transposase
MTVSYSTPLHNKSRGLALGKILWRKRLTRHAFIPFIAQLLPVLIGIEACGGAHDWARRFREHGHDVKLMAPQFVKPFVKSNKNARSIYRSRSIYQHL